MLSSLSSRVRTLRYSRSPCIFLFPGGGFQLLMFRTLRHWIHCNDTLVFTHNSFFLHSINDFKSLITFLSSLTGCRGVRGRSLHPGRMWSGGLWSTQEPRFETLSFPAGRVQSKKEFSQDGQRRTQSSVDGHGRTFLPSCPLV